MKYSVKLVILCLGLSILNSACSHNKRKPTSDLGPIQVTLILNQQGNYNSNEFITLKPTDHYNKNTLKKTRGFEYQSVYDNLALHKDKCFQFVDQFKKGQVLLPQRQKLMGTIANYYRIAQSNASAPPLEFSVHVEYPKERLNKGRVYTPTTIQFKANYTDVNQTISCNDFHKKDMYTLIETVDRSYKQKTEVAQSIYNMEQRQKSRRRKNPLASE